MLRGLSSSLGLAGALVGFVFSFFEGKQPPSPEILKLQEMIKETQIQIADGNNRIENAIQQLDYDSVRRDLMMYTSTLKTLVSKHIFDQIPYELDKATTYEVTCGATITDCNYAFKQVCTLFDELLLKNFKLEPKGDKQRVIDLANDVMDLIVNSYYSVTWLNTNHYKQKNPEKVLDPTDIKMIEIMSEAKYLKEDYDHAVNAYERWVVNKIFQTCRLCDSCGGNFPQENGQNFQGEDYGYWERHISACTEGTPQSKNEVFKFCCSKDEPLCSFCEASCGGDYPYSIGGSLFEENPRHTTFLYSMKGANCQGDFQKKKKDFQICCRNKKQCKLCEGDCLAGYNRVGGQLQNKQEGRYHLFKVYENSKCTPEHNEDPTKNIYADQIVSLCCRDDITDKEQI